MHSGEFLLRTAPEPGESLASWYVRTAHSFALLPYTFGHIMWPGVAILTRDIDGHSNPTIWKRLAEANGTSTNSAFATTVASKSGKVFDRHVPNGKTRWLLRLGIFHRSRRRFGQQFCPHCLVSGVAPFYRLSWRFSFSTVCTLHGGHLLDRCQSCRHAVEFHRINPLKSTIAHCFKCGSRFDRQSASPAPMPLVELQKYLEAASNTGTVEFGNHRQYSSVDLFSIYAHLIRIVATGPKSQRLRDVLAEQYGFDPSPIKYPTEAREYEALDVESRSRLAMMCAPLLLDWPDRFVDACRHAEFWASWTTRDGFNLPTEYTRVTGRFLDGSPLLSSRYRDKMKTSSSVALPKRKAAISNGNRAKPYLRSCFAMPHLANHKEVLNVKQVERKAKFHSVK